jgi:hypothetical protein
MEGSRLVMSIERRVACKTAVAVTLANITREGFAMRNFGSAQGDRSI